MRGSVGLTSIVLKPVPLYRFRSPTTFALRVSLFISTSRVCRGGQLEPSFSDHPLGGARSEVVVVIVDVVLKRSLHAH